MNNKHREILTTHRHFLIKNIIWTEQLGSLLKTNGVLTDSMLSDIESCSSRDDKISRLLDLLPMRGSQAFDKFSDLLQLSGHYFLSDFLRDEAANDKTDGTDLSRRFPFIAKSLKDVERKQLENYIAEKLQAEQTKRVWKKDAKEKDRWLDLKQQQLEDTYLFEVERKTNTEKIAIMEDETKSAQEECIALKAQLKAMENAMSQMQQKHKEEIAIQRRYNMANDNAINKNNEKLEFLERVVRTIHHKVNDRVKPVPRKKKAISDKVPIEFHYVTDDFEALLAEFDRLLEVERTHKKLVEDCNWVISHMGFKTDEDDALSLLKFYKQFSIQNEETIRGLKEEIHKNKQMIEHQKQTIDFQEGKVRRLEEETKVGIEATKLDADGDENRGMRGEEQRKMAAGASVWQAAIMNVMRKQLQDIKLETRKKESRIIFQEEDIKKLRAKIKQYEKKYARDKEKLKDQKEKQEEELPKKEEKNSPDLFNGLDSISPASAANDSPKLKVLPPLRFGYISKPSVSSTPRPLPLRHLQASIPRNLGPISSQYDGAYPEGLTTTQVKFENRPRNNMADGVGGLKTIHKRNKSSAVVQENS